MFKSSSIVALPLADPPLGYDIVEKLKQKNFAQVTIAKRGKKIC